MKVKIRDKKAFDTVKTFRDIKEKISKEIIGMNITELNAYLEKRNAKSMAKK